MSLEICFPHQGLRREPTLDAFFKLLSLVERQVSFGINHDAAWNNLKLRADDINLWINFALLLFGAHFENDLNWLELRVNFNALLDISLHVRDGTLATVTQVLDRNDDVVLVKENVRVRGIVAPVGLNIHRE